jgi:glycosyltransferase involved in cell wall biosynthesis
MTAPVKVVHVTSVHPALDNRILFKECVSLRRAGYDVVLVAPHEHDETVAGVRIRGFPRASGRLARMTRGVRAAIALCEQEAGDVYHFHDPELMPAMHRLVRRGRAVIFDMHENVVADIRGKPWLPAWLRAPLAHAVRLGMRRWLRGVRVVFAEHSYPRDYGWIARGVTVLNLPRLEVLLGVPERRAPDFRVGYLGSITAQRGSVLTLDALRLLAGSGLTVGFDCIGLASDEHVAELRARAARYGLGGVAIVAQQAPERAYALLARCHVGLAVLDDDANLRDSYPTKLFEYMALGLPVIVSDFPLWREVVDGARCGVCVPPSDAAALAAAIERLARDPSAARAMGARGRRAAQERYRWESEEVKLLALYAELVGAPPVDGGGPLAGPTPSTARQGVCTAPASGALPS